MKKALLCLVMAGVCQALLAQSYPILRDATTAEAKLELAAEKTEYQCYDPVRLHLKITYLGLVDSGKTEQSLGRNLRLFSNLHVKGTVSCPTMLGPGDIIGLGQGQMPEDVPYRSRAALPGDSLEADFWVFPVCLLSAPGEYELWIGGNEAVGEGRPYESNHVRITVVEAQGKEKEALDFVKEPARLLALMGGPIGAIRTLKEPDAIALYGHRGCNMKEDVIPYWQRFVNKAEGSAYHPFALFSLSRAYLLGWAETRKKDKMNNRYVYSREPDYELLLQSADEFLKLYPDHPLANEEHFFRLVALYGLGKKDDAAKEYDLIHERLAPLEKMLAEEAARYQDERAREEWMSTGPLYVWAAARKVKDLFENNMVNGRKRVPPPKLLANEWPVQARDICNGSDRPIFKSRWAPW